MLVTLKTDTLDEHLSRRCLSRRSFAIKAGLSNGYLTQLLKGSRLPSTQARQKLLQATGMEFDQLFTIVSSKGTAL